MKMKVELQGQSECLLASIAAITGKELSYIRNRACELAGVRKWRETSECKSANLFWSTMIALGKELGIYKMIERKRDRFALVGQSMVIPNRGRGIITIGHPNQRLHHAMPYQRGLIYDPNNPTVGRTQKDMIESIYPDWMIISITPMKDDSLDNHCSQCGAQPGRTCKYPSGYAKSDPHKARKSVNESIYK